MSTTHESSVGDAVAPQQVFLTFRLTGISLDSFSLFQFMNEVNGSDSDTVPLTGDVCQFTKLVSLSSFWPSPHAICNLADVIAKVCVNLNIARIANAVQCHN